MGIQMKQPKPPPVRATLRVVEQPDRAMSQKEFKEFREQQLEEKNEGKTRDK
jgi:hypothetical protein